MPRYKGTYKSSKSRKSYAISKTKRLQKTTFNRKRKNGKQPFWKDPAYMLPQGNYTKMKWGT